MNDPLAAAALVLFRVQEEGFREVLAGLPDEALNWRPGPDTNSIAVLVEHAWGSAAAWTARSVGLEIPRDRAAEFRAQRDGPELREVVARGLARVEALLASARPGQVWRGRRAGRVPLPRLVPAACRRAHERASGPGAAHPPAVAAALGVTRARGPGDRWGPPPSSCGDGPKSRR